jgi:hypothetical protein
VHSKKHLSFGGLRKTMARRFEQINDHRQDGKVDHSLHDCLMSGLAMMYFQDPSLLAFQQRLEDKIQKNNLKTLFQIQTIPRETQLRDTVDLIPSEALNPIFDDFLSHLQRGKHLSDYQFLNGHYLIPIDGSEYFSSDTIHCSGCLRKEHAKGNVRYHHQILQAVIVHPDKRIVLPLAPEPIKNSDGTQKQDCEINAGKRHIQKIRNAHPKLKIIITGDDLYSKQPFLDELKKARMSFILVAKPGDHKVLFEWVNELHQLGEGDTFEYTDQKNRRHWYRWVNQVPLNGTKDADHVNFFEYHLIKNGKITYRNSWVTDKRIDKNNIETLVKGGRARWKIENETFNTLKNQGYHLEHNFGHGKHNLSLNFFILNLLAFYIHQILELTDHLYHTVRYTKFTSRKEYWNQLRCTIRILIFPHWESLLQFILDPESGIPP